MGLASNKSLTKVVILHADLRLALLRVPYQLLPSCRDVGYRQSYFPVFIEGNDDPAGTISPAALVFRNSRLGRSRLSKDGNYLRFAHSLVNPIKVLLRNPAPWREEPSPGND